MLKTFKVWQTLKVWCRLRTFKVWQTFKVWCRLRTFKVWQTFKVWRRLKTFKVWQTLKVWCRNVWQTFKVLRRLKTFKVWQTLKVWRRIIGRNLGGWHRRGLNIRQFKIFLQPWCVVSRRRRHWGCFKIRKPKRFEIPRYFPQCAFHTFIQLKPCRFQQTPLLTIADF